MRRFIALAILAATSLSLLAQAPKPAPKSDAAKAACAPAPRELVKKDLEPGTGREVKSGYAVLVGYTGWLYDGCAPGFKGAKFDSSEGRPAPFGFMVGAGKVIKGWDEGVVGMKEKDAKRLLIIPPEKGYGERGAGGVIPPNATLVFEVQTFQIVHPPAGEPAKGPAQEKK